MPQFTITARGRQQTVDSDLTPEQAIEFLSRCTGNFAVELYRTANQARRRPLSHAQWGWIHCLALEQRDRERQAEAPRAEADVPDMNLSGVQRLFRQALLSGLRNPRLRFVVNGKVIRLTVAGPRARVPGSVNVTDDGRYPDNTFYGRIHEDGRWERSHRNRCDEVDFLMHELAEDAVAAANRYGHESGQCCFCGRPLTVSTVGYGPDCAERWGLPYDSLTLQEGRSRRQRRHPVAVAEPNYPLGGYIEAAMNTPPEASSAPQDASPAPSGWESTATPPVAVAEPRRRLTADQREMAEDVMECMRRDGTDEGTLERLARAFGLI